MKNFPNSMRLTALLATLACLAGCGSMPNAPVFDDSTARVATSATTNQASTLPIDETVPGGPQVTPDPEPEPEPELPTQGGPAPNQGTVLTETLGGTVKYGRWRIEVPPGAVTGSARFSVSASSARSGIVNLGIFPADKNHFDPPVMLVADCHTVPPGRLSTWFISWYNPATGGWERVPGSTVDTKKKTVSVPLTHFSTYMVGPEAGRAGW